MLHPYIPLLEKIYSDLKKRDFAAALSACPDEMTLQIAGQSQLAGRYSKKDVVARFLTPLIELSSGTHAVAVHDILASDQHAVVLVTESLERGSEKIEYRAAHVWRFENQKPRAWYVYPRDLYQYDSIWAK